jgi:hypothetical protein
MNEELQHLWALRELDERRSQACAALARYPEQRSALDARVVTSRSRLDALRARMTEAQKTRRDREREAEAVSEQERKFQSQLPAVKKNEEYTALLHEIAGAKAKRSDIETQVLMLLEDEEKLQHERPRAEAALAEAEAEAASRRAAIDAEERDERARLQAIEDERAVHVARLGAGTRTRYERIHGSLDGRAVVPVLKGACGGCYRTQPPQMLQEAKRGDRLLTCDGCGRLMIWPPDSA